MYLWLKFYIILIVKFSKFTLNAVLIVLKYLLNKASVGADDSLSCVVKKCAPMLTELLLHLFNLILSSFCFWKKLALKVEVPVRLEAVDLYLFDAIVARSLFAFCTNV